MNCPKCNCLLCVRWSSMTTTAASDKVPDAIQASPWFAVGKLEGAVVELTRRIDALERKVANEKAKEWPCKFEFVTRDHPKPSGKVAKKVRGK